MKYATGSPATARDFAWWSGLSLADARAGLAALAGVVERETIGTLTYWFVPSRLGARPSPPLVHLLPNYDEGLIAYKDCELPGGLPAPVGAARHGNFPHHMVIEGRLAGAWRRAATVREVAIDVLPYRAMARSETRALSAAIDEYGRFMELPAALAVI